MPFIDDSKEINIVQVESGAQKNYKNPVDDVKNGGKDDLIIYFNFILDNKGTLYTRQRYNILDLMED